MPEIPKKDLTNSETMQQLNVNDKLLELILGYLPNKQTFTGQVTVEVHCRDGTVKEVFLHSKNRLKL